MSCVDMKSYMSMDDAQKLAGFSREAVKASAEARIQLEQEQLRNQNLARQNQELHERCAAWEQQARIAKGEKDQIQFDLDARNHLARRQAAIIEKSVETPSLFSRIPFHKLGMAAMIIAPNAVLAYLAIHNWSSLFAG